MRWPSSTSAAARRRKRLAAIKASDDSLNNEIFARLTDHGRCG